MLSKKFLSEYKILVAQQVKTFEVMRDQMKDQWQVFRAEWGYHLFFWLFLSFLAALIAAGRMGVDDDVLPESNPIKSHA